MFASIRICESDQSPGIEDLHALTVLGFSGGILFGQRDNIDLLRFQILQNLVTGRGYRSGYFENASSVCKIYGH